MLPSVDAAMFRELLVDKGDGTFTCKAWNPHTRLCTIYDKRPFTCREYPVEHQVCEWCGMEGPWLVSGSPAVTS